MLFTTGVFLLVASLTLDLVYRDFNGLPKSISFAKFCERTAYLGGSLILTSLLVAAWRVLP